jgi:hypothetical protein
MAYVSETWGCFIHIPKTGGLWVKTVLKELDKGAGHDGFTHGLPMHWFKHGRYWTVIREPVAYYRSLYAHRIRNDWRAYAKEVPWKNLCELLLPYESYDDFPGFVEGVTRDLPGLLGWFYDMYIPPPVEVFITGTTIYDHLRSLGARPDMYPPHNAAPAKGRGSLPKMTYNLIEMITASEKDLYARYNFE